MDIVIKLLLFVHLFALVIGMGSGLALSRVGPFLANADDSQRSVLFKLSMVLGKNGHIGLALLWITGPLLVWLAYGGVTELSMWFWAKIVLVVILSASIGMSSAAARRLRAGDISQAPRIKMLSMISAISGMAVILCAVFAFN